MTASHPYSPYGHPQGQQQADGSWVRNLPERFALKLAIAFGTLDAAVLYTAAKRMLLERLFWEVTANFAGGTASAVGVSSSGTGYTAKGALLGGAAGDVAATLVPGIAGGTLGTKFGTNGIVLLEPGATIRFDRIASAFTGGAGFVHVIGQVIE
jgi:hypothetical protein